MKKCLNINLFGGPGCGKSVTSAGLFAKMRKNGMKVELLDEHAKSLVFSKNFSELSDQLMVFAKQRHKIEKLKGQVDYTVNDGPFLLSNIYYTENENLPEDLFKKLVIETFKSYETINILLKRTSEHPYQEYGRNETFEEAKELDEKIEKMLIENNIPYITVTVGKKTIKEIFKLVKKQK